MKITITADGRNLSATTNGQPLTSGSVGIEAAFVLSADYDGLAVTAVFSTEETRVDVLLTKSCCIVPWEVLRKPGTTLFVGVVGKNGSGEIVIPTVWGRVGMIECGTVASGIDPEDPTPDLAAQLLEQAREALAEAAETKEAAAQSAETAGNEANRAEAARQAVEDLGVTAHEDQSGPNVEKIVNPETGAVTLDFGFKPAGVTEVNGQTGAVSLDLDDIPDGAQYVRPTPAQVRQIGTNAEDIDAIEAKIPPQASATNQLADKDFVNSSISSSTAFFRGSFASHAALFAVPWQTADPAAANYVTNNDYAYVADDETHNDEAWRYIYVLQPGGTGNGWQPQFKVNDSPLTAAQLAALNSGATAEIIASIADKYELPEGGMPSADMSADVRASLQKADTALQAVPDTYRTAAEQDTIDAAQDERIDAAEQATTATTVGPAPIATFDASAADMPLKGLTVNIEPVQAGEGDPSPENIRPITGWTGCNIVQSPTLNAQDGTTYPVTFPASAGTVYGGTLDVTTGELTVDVLYCETNSAGKLVPYLPGTGFAPIRCTAASNYAYFTIPIIVDAFTEDGAQGCNRYGIEFCGTGVAENDNSCRIRKLQNVDRLTFKQTSIPGWGTEGFSGSDIEAYFAENPLQVIIPLSTPIILQLTPTEVTTLLGTNSVWADTGDVTVTYGAYLETFKAHADRLGDSILSAIAPLEASYTASQPYTVGSFLFVGTKLYKVTQAIAEGGTITPGTNAVQTTVAEQLIALAAG